MSTSSPLARLISTTIALLVSCCLTAAQVNAQGQDVTVKTGEFEVTFSAKGGVPTAWRVIDRATAVGDSAPMVDLVDAEYLAASAERPLSLLLGADQAADLRPYQIAQAEDGGRTVVTCSSQPDANGLQIVKRYTLTRGSYMVELTIELTNTGASSLEFEQPRITVGPCLGLAPGRTAEPFDEGRDPTINAFFKTDGGVFDLTVHGEASEADGDEQPAPPAAEWGGLESQYFTMVVVPNSGRDFVAAAAELRASPAIDKLVSADDRAAYLSLVLTHEPIRVEAGASATVSYAIYAGPKERAALAASSLGLDSILFHYLWNWLAAVCLALQDILLVLKGVLGSYGLSIIAFAVLFRLVTLPLSLYGAKHSLLMQGKMAELKPVVAELKVKYAKNSDKLNQAILALYKEHGINPFSHFKGCLPLFIQLPVLIALFNLLLHSYDLRGAQFLWIGDLTLTDRLFALPFSLPWLGSYLNLLPLVMFGAMIMVGRAMRVPGSAPSGSPGLKYLMPVAMTLLFYPFPAGCMLFWTTGNLIQIAEQRFTTARVAKMTT